MDNISFQDLNLIDPLIKAVNDDGYSSPTDIQLQTIPVALLGRDLIALAQTGTGKSAAFCLPILQSIHLNKVDNGYSGIRALILAPTRELAVQIDNSLSSYGRHTCVNHTAIFGGIPRKVQIDHLDHEIDILVATPGRLLDMVDRGYVDLSKVSYLVIDEADSMLSLGFIDDVKKIISMLPNNRQSMLFSATMPMEISSLAKSILTNPVNISVSVKTVTSGNIEQKLYWVDKKDKLNLLLYILNNTDIDSAFVFVSTKQSVDLVSKYLYENGFDTEAIHSDRTQKEREQALDKFRSKHIKILVATDVVARGIDIDNVSHVFNIELPQDSENYIHRIGRTARAGSDGVAITLSDPEDMEKINKIESLIKHKIDVIDNHPYMNLSLRCKFFQMVDSIERKDMIKNKKRRRK